MKIRLFLALAFALVLWIRGRIAAQTATEYALIGEFGRGNIDTIWSSPDGKTTAVTTIRGVWFYQTENVYAPPRLLSLPYHNLPEIDWEDYRDSETYPRWLPYRPHRVAFDPAWERMAIAEYEGGITLRDVATGELLTALDRDGIEYDVMQFSADGETLAASLCIRSDCEIDLWDIAAGEVRQTIPSPMLLQPRAMLFSPDGRYLVVNTEELGGDYSNWELSIFEIARGELVFSEGHLPPSEPPDLDMPPLTVGTGIYNSGYRLTFGDAETPFSITYLDEYPDVTPLCDGISQCDTPITDLHASVLPALETLTFPIETNVASLYPNPPSTDWRWKVFVSGDGRWSVESGSLDSDRISLTRLADGEHFDLLLTDELNFPYTMRNIRFSPDGRWVAMAFGTDLHGGTGDNTLRVWDVGGNTPVLQPVATLEHVDTLRNLVFSLDSRRLALSLYNGEVYVWNADDWTLIDTIVHPSPVSALAFSDDVETLVTFAEDGLLRLWRGE